MGETPQPSLLLPTPSLESLVEAEAQETEVYSMLPCSTDMSLSELQENFARRDRNRKPSEWASLPQSPSERRNGGGVLVGAKFD